MDKDTRMPQEIVAENDWEVSHKEDDSQILDICKKIITDSPSQVTGYKETGRRDRVLRWFVGQAMKELKGKANPEGVATTMQKLLDEASL